MRKNHLWNRAKDVKIQTTPDIVGNFSIGFDSKISEETKDVLMRFVYWVEDNFNLPITLWVDFKYRHYLIRDGKRVGYKFYWADFKSYPVFDNPDDIPVIELPVRTGHRTNEEILKSFIKGITQYYMWLIGFEITDANEDEVDEVLQAYLQENDLRQRVHLHFAVPQAQRNWLLGNASLFVSPSRKEGFGRTPVEAAICQIPVISRTCDKTNAACKRRQ